MRIALLLSLAVCAQAQRVIAVNVDGIIHPVTVEIIGHAIDQASRENASAVLLRLNTPGGLIDSSREIAIKIEGSRVPVIAYVTPSGGRAASAGFFLLEASDVAAMSPGTNTGAASPVLINEQMDPVMRRKVENDTSAWLRSTVEKRGRNVELAETTVREAKAFSEKEALDGRLIDRIEPDEHALLAQLDGVAVKRFDGSQTVLHTRGAEVVEYQKTLRERIVAGVADPNIGFILLVLGVLGIYVEFSSPGLIFPGVAGGILALLGLSSLAVLPINWAGAALLLLGLSLFVLEAKFASHGILGIGGAVAMVLGAMLLIDGPPEMRIHLSTALSVTFPFALITMLLVTLVIRARANKAVMGTSTLVDQIAEARTALSPSGTVFLQGEYWNAESEAPVEKGAQVRIVCGGPEAPRFASWKMKTLEIAHAEILERLSELRPDSARRWGKMSCHQMIVHLSDSFMLPLGGRKVTQATVPIPRGIFKWLALYVPMKWPHGVKTMPEMEQGVGGTPPVEFQKDRKKLVELIQNFSKAQPGSVTHPIFGAMTNQDWQRWGYLHCDHHLRQFGV